MNQSNYNTTYSMRSSSMEDTITVVVGYPETNNNMSSNFREDHMITASPYPALKIDVHAANMASQMIDDQLIPCLPAHPSAISVPSGGTEISSWPPTSSSSVDQALLSPSSLITHMTPGSTHHLPSSIVPTIIPIISSPAYDQTPSKLLATPRTTVAMGSGGYGEGSVTASPSSLQQRRSKNNSSLKLALDGVKEIELQQTLFSMERGLPLFHGGGSGEDGGSLNTSGGFEFASPFKETDIPRITTTMDRRSSMDTVDYPLSGNSRFSNDNHPAWLVWNDGGRMLEVDTDYCRDLRGSDLREDRKLGHGSSGDVTKVTHVPTGRVMAKKCVRLEPKQTSQQQILRELQVLRECHSPYIVSFYGAFFTTDGSINMCMEYMDLGSLDPICRELGGIDERVMGKIALSVLHGLVYLYDGFRIMHRDIKPSNILLNSKGEVKLCDFGVSGSLVNSVANSFVGTSAYMAPERIQGCKYTIQSDVWSFGLTLLELTTGVFPLPEVAGVFELMQEIVRAPAPRLPPHRYSPEYEDFIAQCLTKDFEQRPSPMDLLHHPFMLRSAHDDFDMRAFSGHVIVTRRQRKYEKVLSSSRQQADFPVIKH